MHPSARIHGVGTDVCDLRRIAAALERRGERFAEKVLGPSEILVWRARGARSSARGIAYLGTRFSAKEAFSKAIGLGLRHPMTWRGCEILNRPSGQPFIRLHGVLAQWFEARGLQAHVTLSDESDTAVSFVVVEALAPSASASDTHSTMTGAAPAATTAPTMPADATPPNPP